MRIFLDANVLFSAAKSDGGSRRVIDLLVAAGHELLVDGHVLEEARRNLNAKSPSSFQEFGNLVTKLAVYPSASDHPAIEKLELAEKDRPVLAAALLAGADVFATGDLKHFGHLMGSKVGPTAIHSVASLVDLVWP